MGELERKFPGISASDSPKTGEGGWVGSPIPPERAAKMSDRAWLRAMQRYRPGVKHREFLKGGHRELGTVLLELVKSDPERFFVLVSQAPDSIVTLYATTFINGLADSSAPPERLYALVGRFAPHLEPNDRTIISWALQKKVEAGLPSDLLDMLESWVRDRPTPDPDGFSDPYSTYINTTRGAALQVLMRALDHLNSPESREAQMATARVRIT